MVLRVASVSEELEYDVGKQRVCLLLHGATHTQPTSPVSEFAHPRPRPLPPSVRCLSSSAGT